METTTYQGPYKQVFQQLHFDFEPDQSRKVCSYRSPPSEYYGFSSRDE